MAADGSFLVVWRDDRRSGTNWDVYGNRVNTSGGGVDGDGFAIAKANADEQQPALTADPGTDGGFGVVYRRFAPEAPTLRLEPRVLPHLAQVARSTRGLRTGPGLIVTSTRSTRTSMTACPPCEQRELRDRATPPGRLVVM